MLGPPKPISSPCIPVCIDTICVRRVRKKKRSREQDIYRTFPFRYTHVTVDTYENEVQHNTGHTSLYKIVRTVDTKITIMSLFTNMYGKISTVVVFDASKKILGEEHRSRSALRHLIMCRSPPQLSVLALENWCYICLIIQAALVHLD
jgi:hypothetical protein